ncbi:MAG TPA: DUF4397 domain-containing protein [Mucilaginibacter sp.]|nr:DUF4397 domain-containing protein [Mucilaginibacter sp.]
MKNLRKFTKKNLFGFGVVGLLLLMTSSCIKSHDDTPPTPVALVSVIQDSPGQDPLYFTLNGARVNQSALVYGSGLDYFTAYTGTRTIAFVKANTGAVVASDTVTLKQNLAYTVCLVNKSDSPELLVLNDAITQPTSGNANLRFVNLSPDAPAVDLAVKDGDVLVSNKSFKGSSAFSSITAKDYSFEIRQAGTNTVLATLDNVSIKSGFVYTIYFRGLKDATDGNKLTADLIVNAAY